MNQLASHSYTRIDNNAAKIGGQGRINATGGYEGVITRAEPVKKSSGVIGIEIDFKTGDGASALFLDLYTQNGQGEELSGRRIVDALMLCLRVKSMDTKRITVEKWDNDAKAMIKTTCENFVDLIGKPIGLVLQKEHSVYKGQPKERMIIYACYDIASRKTPKEIMERSTKAVALDTILATIKDKHVKPKDQAGGGSHGNGYGNGGANSMPDFDDDIPY